METRFKTPELFARYLPPMKGGYPLAVRWHFADMAQMPLFPTMPDDAWDDFAWTALPKQAGAPMRSAVRLAKEGWQEGAEEAHRLHAGLHTVLPQRRQLSAYSMAGVVPNVPRFLAGNPAHMRRMVRSETAQRPILTLVVNIGVHAGCAARDMMQHAVAVAGIVDFLESGRFRCDVIAVSRTATSLVGVEIAVRLKAPEQPVNLSVLAYGLGHVSFFRRLVFAVRSTEPDASGLGSSMGSTEVAPATPDLGTYTLPNASQLFEGSPAPARFRKLLEGLKAQGCPGIPEDMGKAA